MLRIGIWDLLFGIYEYKYCEQSTTKENSSPQVYDVGGYWQYSDDVCRVDKCFYCKEQPGWLADDNNAESILGFYGCYHHQQYNTSDGVKIF